MDAIRTTRTVLNNRVPLIGFSGSPWTLATYMVEGHGSKNFRFIKELMYSHPADAHALLDKLSRAVADYLSAQIAAGAQAVQIFDTWGGILSQEDFEEFSLRYIRQTISLLQRGDTPVIVFCKDCGHSLPKIADCGADVVGLDWTMDIGASRASVGDRVALQGNLDPVLLFATPDRIEKGVSSILEKFGSHDGHVFNLGHGILPETSVENVHAFVRAVKTLGKNYHTGKAAGTN
jgi:uroporphyrinogen decarboxylase